MSRPNSSIAALGAIALIAIFAVGISLWGIRSIESERDDRIAGNTDSLVIACHKRNDIQRTIKAIIASSVASSSNRGFPADIVARIQDPAVRDLLTAISGNSQGNNDTLKKAGEAITLENCAAIRRRAG